ncbi:hypothetical protein G6F54_014550 [Rhizopus delemar]|nr:hypothetical protein G6F54_014550 [Rhizopus delemar]
MTEASRSTIVRLLKTFVTMFRRSTTVGSLPMSVPSEESTLETAGIWNEVGTGAPLLAISCAVARRQS